MSEFKTPLVARLLPECPGTELWQLVEPLEYQSDILGTIIVPVGFVTDFVSFKELNFMAHRASCIHDWLYDQGAISRKTADDVLREALEVINTPPILIEAIYTAVRLFGASHKKGEN